MDKEQAKFILQSFRPDGADASDADFAEALEFAARDRELGEWLASERAADAQFANALGHTEAMCLVLAHNESRSIQVTIQI